MENKFKIKNSLIKEALFGSFTCDYSKLENCTGYINDDLYEIGRSFLTFCYSVIFNIHRMYGFEEGYLSKIPYKRNAAFSQLTTSDIKEACNELEELYEFTQKYLKKNKYLTNNKIKLTRALRPFEIIEISDQLRNKNENILMKTNVLSSYAEYGSLHDYGSCVSVYREIPIDDIVIFYEAIEYPNESCLNVNPGGEYEVWVLNKDPLGCLEVTFDKFKVDFEQLNRKYNKEELCGNVYNKYSDRNGEVLIPYTSKPCQTNKIVKFLLRHTGKN